MNSEKVGIFIAEERKKKGLTQKQLADLLGVTDKAVSRWETGKGYPDIEILKAISETLEVSINELLSGERLAEERIIESAEEHIVYAFRKEKKTKRTSKIAVAIILIFTIMFCGIFVLLFNSVSYYNETQGIEVKANHKETGDLIRELEEILANNFNIKTYGALEFVLITDFNITSDVNNEVLNLDMVLYDKNLRKKVTVKFEKSTGLWNLEQSGLRRKDEKEGMPYSSTIKALKEPDYLALVEKHAPEGEPFNEYIISMGIPMTFSEKEAGFGEGNTYLFSKGELIQLEDTKLLGGTYYAIVLTPWIEVNEGVVASCCNIYIKS